MRITDVVARKVIDEQTLIEAMEGAITVLPPLLPLPSKIVGIDTPEVDDKGVLLSCWSQRGARHSSCTVGHDDFGARSVAHMLHQKNTDSANGARDWLAQQRRFRLYVMGAQDLHLEAVAENIIELGNS